MKLAAPVGPLMEAFGDEEAWWVPDHASEINLAILRPARTSLGQAPESQQGPGRRSDENMEQISETTSSIKFHPVSPPYRLRVPQMDKALSRSSMIVRRHSPAPILSDGEGAACVVSGVCLSDHGWMAG